MGQAVPGDTQGLAARSHRLLPRRCPPSRACASCACCPSQRTVRGLAAPGGGSAVGLGLSSRQHPVPPGLNPKDYRSLKTQYLQVSLPGGPPQGELGWGVPACLLLAVGHHAAALPRDVPAGYRGWHKPRALPALKGCPKQPPRAPARPRGGGTLLPCMCWQPGLRADPVDPSPELWARALADLPQPQAHRAADRAGGWGDPDGCGEQSQQAGDRPSGW